jgi:uncharacterized protein
LKAYLDASVLLRNVLQEPGSIDNWSRWELIVSSELIRVEAFRSLDRLRLVKRLREVEVAELTGTVRSMLASFQQVPISSAIQDRAAGLFHAVIGTLDAIHLATALVWMEQTEEPLLFVTHDVQLAVAARLAGLDMQTAP